MGKSKNMWDMNKVKEINIKYLKELEEIEKKRAARYKPWDEKYQEHISKAGEISGLISIIESL